MPETATEVIIKLKAPPQRLFADSVSLTGSTNYLRFRLSSSSAIALAARVKRAGQEFDGDQRELYLSDVQPGEEAPYERLLGAAMAGDGRFLPARTPSRPLGRSSIPCSYSHRPARPYRRRSWGPLEADALIKTDGGWHNPTSDKVPRSRTT